jgi:hypothetical protein
MKSRPIIFSAPMVRAALDGSKTQTRRVVKGLPIFSADMVGFYSPDDDDHWTAMDGGTNIVWRKLCPYGQPGDELWVREAHAIVSVGGAIDDVIHYRATPGRGAFAYADGRMRMDYPLGLVYEGKWSSPIHMPRWASRITLTVTGIRVERLQGISAQDCWAEGIPFSPDTNPRHEYRDLWESIHGAGSWEASPWVWVIEFERKMP